MKKLSEWYGALWLAATLVTAMGPFVAIEVLYRQGTPMVKALEIVGVVVMVLWPLFVYVSSVLLYLMSRELKKDWWDV